MIPMMQSQIDQKHERWKIWLPVSYMWAVLFYGQRNLISENISKRMGQHKACLLYNGKSYFDLGPITAHQGSLFVPKTCLEKENLGTNRNPCCSPILCKRPNYFCLNHLLIPLQTNQALAHISRTCYRTILIETDSGPTSRWWQNNLAPLTSLFLPWGNSSNSKRKTTWWFQLTYRR